MSSGAIAEQLRTLRTVMFADCIVDGDTLEARNSRELVKSAAYHVDTAIADLKIAEQLGSTLACGSPNDPARESLKGQSNA